jgi:hypothetical protein
MRYSYTVGIYLRNIGLISNVARWAVVQGWGGSQKMIDTVMYLAYLGEVVLFLWPEGFESYKD